MNMLLDLFLTVAKVGVMTFGGGYAMLPILQRELVENKHWAAEEELVDYFAIGQCTPGVIAVNTATFVGQKFKGIVGGIVATLGVVFPSLVIISLLAGVISAFSHLQWVQHAFGGIRICVCILICNAVVKLYKKAVVDKITLVVFLLVALGAYFLSVSPVLFVVLSAVIGIAVKHWGVRKWCCICGCSMNFSRRACLPSAVVWPPFRSFMIWLTPPAGLPIMTWPT